MIKIRHVLAWQLVVDALKVTPTNPTFLDGRDAILRAFRRQLPSRRPSGDPGPTRRCGRHRPRPPRRRGAWWTRAVSLPDASRAFDRKDSTPQLRQETAALRYFNRAYVSLASSTTEAGEATRHTLALCPESDGRPLRCDPPLEGSRFTNQAIERRRRAEKCIMAW